MKQQLVLLEMRKADGLYLQQKMGNHLVPLIKSFPYTSSGDKFFSVVLHAITEEGRTYSERFKGTRNFSFVKGLSALDLIRH